MERRRPWPLTILITRSCREKSSGRTWVDTWTFGTEEKALVMWKEHLERWAEQDPNDAVEWDIESLPPLPDPRDGGAVTCEDVRALKEQRGR